MIDIIVFLLLNIIFFLLFFNKHHKNKTLGSISSLLYLIQLISFIGKCQTKDFLDYIYKSDVLIYGKETAIFGFISLLIGYYIFILSACVLLLISCKQNKSLSTKKEKSN